MPDYEVFIATEEEARAGGEAVFMKLLPLERGQYGRAPDPDSDRIPFCDQFALATLWIIIADKEWDDMLLDAFEQVCEGSADGPWVSRFPPDFVDRLGALSPQQIERVALLWSRTEDFKFMVPEPPAPLLSSLTRLFRRNRQPDTSGITEERVKVARANLEALVRLVQRADQTGKGVFLYGEL